MIEPNAFIASKIFKDRADAGRQLAAALERFKSARPVVLALPRGGVPVAYQVARALEAPLDLVLVRKIGTPWQPELAIAAVVNGSRPEIVINQEVVDKLSIPPSYVEKQAAVERDELERRRRRYLAGRPNIDLAGRTAIVVDDGIATGMTMEAALHAIRRANPAHLVLAVPVASPDTIERLRAEVDDVVCLQSPALFDAVGSFYDAFRQLSDDDVTDLLERIKADEGNGGDRSKTPG